MFSIVWEREENRKRGKPGRKIFSPGPTNFVLPNWEEKPKWKTVSQHFYHNTPVLESSKKKKKIETERWRNKKQRMSILCAWNVLEEK